MALTFRDETWLFVEAKIKEQIEKHTSVCTNSEKTYKEVLQAQAKIAALKTILNLPQVGLALAATRGNNVN